MKKCGIFAIAALMTILCGRLNAAVESDIVGYTTYEMTAAEGGTWYILGNPFGALDESETFLVNDAFALDGFSSGDLLYVLEASGSLKIHHWYDKNGNTGWSTRRASWDPNTDPLPRGTAVYLKKMTTGSILFSGRVISAPAEFGDELSAGSTWSMIVPLWPEAKKLNDLTWTGMSTKDRLYLLEPTGSLKIHYWYDKNGNTGWSTLRGSWSPNETVLVEGTGLYISKAAGTKGTVIAQ